MRPSVFNQAYEVARNNGYNAADSIKIADKVHNTPKEEVITPNIVVGKKSFAIDTSYFTQGNVLDILVGYPEADTEELFGGASLDKSGWNNVPNKEYTFDLNHFKFDALQGVRNDLEESWQGFKVKVKDFYKNEDGLRAKAYVPENEQGTKFIQDYNQGKYGVSIEYQGDQQGEVVKDWEIIGGTFHTDPSYSKTKPKGL